MLNNRKLNKAKKSKRDEFYTQVKDIEDELVHYTGHFKDKVIYCNCDDPKGSNFFYYFYNNFQSFKLKKLIVTGYRIGNIHLLYQGAYLEYNGDNFKIDIIDGDFRSDECINLLRQADIVVTNPPFSIFIEYIYHLIKYEKKFLIMCDVNALKYKGPFKLIKEKKIWIGITNGSKWFEIPKEYEIKNQASVREKNGKRYFRKGNIHWLTNLEVVKQYKTGDLNKTYANHENEYSLYDNYNAINVDRYKDIPIDYDGYIGVPITFLSKYNPDQFEIIDLDSDFIKQRTGKRSNSILRGKEKYTRIVIKKIDVSSRGHKHHVNN